MYIKMILHQCIYVYLHIFTEGFCVAAENADFSKCFCLARIDFNIIHDISVYTKISVYIHTHVCILMYAYLYMYMYTYIYIYIYIHTISTYIYVYIHENTQEVSTVQRKMSIAIRACKQGSLQIIAPQMQRLLVVCRQWAGSSPFS